MFVKTPPGFFVKSGFRRRVGDGAKMEVIEISRLLAATLFLIAVPLDCILQPTFFVF